MFKYYRDTKLGLKEKVEAYKRGKGIVIVVGNAFMEINENTNFLCSIWLPIICIIGVFFLFLLLRVLSRWESRRFTTKIIQTKR